MDTSELISFYFLVFLVFHFLVVVSCVRLSWLMSALKRTLKWHLISYRISSCEHVCSNGSLHSALNHELQFSSVHVLWTSLYTTKTDKGLKVGHTRLPSVGFRSRSRFLAASLQVTWVINPAVDCHYFLPGLQLPSQPLRGLPPILLPGEQRHNGCEQFA